jgi:hypothetical protein
MSAEGIVRCAIHPGIGIARVGNSPDGYFFGPEVPGVPPNPERGFKDGAGRIKRQVAIFRIYGYDAAGRVVREITADDSEISWAVWLANKKAAWYRFKIPLDLEEARNLPPGLRCTRRNAGHGDRRELVIGPVERSLGGKNAPEKRFEASFFGRTVSLGEVRSGPKGGLWVFGGSGRAGTFGGSPPLKHFANNDGWYDDIADGPVTATVNLGGRRLPVDPAWVIVAPPDYTPGIPSIVTLYDIAYQAHLDAHPGDTPPRVSFSGDIYPIFERFDRLQWVNEGFYQGYGWKGQVALLDPARLARLADARTSAKEEREGIFKRFRDPAYEELREDAWPRVYGDGFDMPTGRDPKQYLTVTREQYRRLRAWARGEFDADWNPNARPPQALDGIPLRDRPHALDRAALEACDGGAFHPGWEATWPMRHPSMYSGLSVVC